MARVGGVLQARVDGGAHDQRMLREAAGDALDLLKGPVEEIIRRVMIAAVDDACRICAARR